ncbi:terepressin/terephysin-like [Limulus polyphemus]|uniref:Terepressin/terephysin-like n=1 Tax=Limulus polyphemus TaxID=6850 RepID=A0ABM1BMA4_LIMPO|nr:terepressin/terephysin-like [Limulus polyphemus]
MHWTSFIMILGFCLAVTIKGCFITNCPPGGKRSIGTFATHYTRECGQCGPGGMGQCQGPDICCSDIFGCFIKTRESVICRYENLQVIPCNKKGKICETVPHGYCAAPGICCSAIQCAVDDECPTGVLDKGVAYKYDHLRFVLLPWNMNGKLPD